jgi:hypothetical protein
MTHGKDSHPHKSGEHMSPQTADLLSKEQAAYQKSEQQHFPVEDKRQVARREHTNGSTPRKSS